MTTVAQLTIEMAANVARLQKDMAKVNSTVDGAMAKVRKSAEFAMKAIGAIGGALTVGALTGLARELGRVSTEIQKFSALTNTSTDTFQKLAFGAQRFGVEQDKLADILKDTQDKIGDFLQTGAGGMADFFEQIAPKVGVTAAQFRNLNGADALQLYISSLEKANLSQAEMVFFMEAIASDSTLLIPLFQDGGKALAEYSEQAERLGLVLSQETIVQAQEFERTMGLLSDITRGFGQQVAAELLPTLQNTAQAFGEISATGAAASAVGQGIKIVFETIVILGSDLIFIIEQIAGGIIALAETAYKVATGDFKGAMAVFPEYNKQAALARAELDKFQASIMGAGSTAVENVVAVQQYTASTGAATASIKDAEKASKKAAEEEKALLKVREMLAKATEEVRKETAAQATAEGKTTDELRQQVKAVRDQIAAFGRSAMEIRSLERANLDFNESVIEMRLRMAEAGFESAELISVYRDQLQAIKDLKAEQDQLYQLEDADKYRQAAEALMAENKNIADTFKDDLLDSIKTAFLQGGSFGEAFARGLKAELIEAFLDPALGQAIARAKGGDFSSIGNILSGAGTAGSSGATLGALLSSGNQIASKLVSITGATGQTSAAILQLGNNLQKIAPYAGSIAALIQGDVKGAAGAALGTYIGNILLPGIGGAIGGFLGGMIGGGGKISATSLGAQFNQDLIKTLQDSFLTSVQSLGGTAANVMFGAGGNTGRQGQNPNFSLNASFGGRNIFGSAQTAEGQADGLFLSGEIALNEKNLTEQVSRAVFAGLQQSDFADNIDEVIAGINAATASFEELTAALSDAQTLAQINEAFKDMEGALGTLSGASREVVADLLGLVGGFEGLMASNDAFYQAFFTEQERAADLLETVTQTFANFGLVLPATRIELRDLVDSLDLRNEADRELYATILQLTPALDQLLPAFENVETAVDNLSLSLLGLAQQITSEAQKAIESQISLSQKAANEARNAANAYFNLRDSLRDVSSGLLGDLVGSEGQFAALFAKAITGDLNALGGLGSAAQAEAQRIRNTATDPVAYLRQTMLLKQQVDQAASVAEVLGLGADYQAQLFDVQTAALEVIRDQLEAGNLTADLLAEQIGVLENIGQMIMSSAQLTVGAVQNAAGQTVGALFDSSGNVVAKLGNDTVLQLQALQNQTNANAQQNNVLGQQVTGGFNNSLTGQTAALGGFSQQQIRELQGIDDTQTEGLSISEIISRATEGSETLLLAVLSKLGQQDTSGLAIVDELQKGNAKISDYLFRLVNIAEKQEAEQIRLETIANLNKEALAAKSQVGQAQTIRSESTKDLSTLQQQAYNLASQFGVFLNEKAGAVQLANTAKFGVNAETGLYQQMFGQISFGSGGNPTAFKNEFYKPGGLFAQIQAEAAQLAEAKRLLDPANTQLAALRQQIIDLGGIPEFANGGMVNSATLAMIGEGKYNEAVVPLPDGRSIPVQMMGSDNKEMVNEMRALRKEVQMLRAEAQQTAVNTGRTYRLMDDVTQGGTEVRTVVVTP